MKKALSILALAAAASFALAQPFVWPSHWTVTPLGEATYGGVFVDFTISDVRTFQPVLQSETNEVAGPYSPMQWATLIMQGPDSDDWIPYAAESFTVDETGTVFDVVLRDGLKWSDGSPITVDDYYASYLLQTDPETGSNKYDSWFLNDVLIRLEITGEKSLRFTFPGPDRSAYAQVEHWPVPDRILGEAYRTGGPDAVNALWGTETDPSELLFNGPFVLTSYQPGERIVFERNPYFGDWNVDEAGNPLPYLDGRIFRIGDQDAILNLFLAGEVDRFAPRNLDDIGVINVAIDNGDIDAVVLEGYTAAGSSQFIVFNWNLAANPFLQSVFRNADFRRAMWHLVDRDTIIDLVYNGVADPMHAGVYLVNDYWLDDSIPTYDFDPERASELLARAGFSRRGADGILVDDQGRRLSFRLATNAGNVQREQITQIFADTARDVGVEVQTEALDFSLLVDQLLSSGDDRPFEAILIGLTGGSRTWPFGDSVYNCDGFLHMYNTSGECLSAQETLMEQLNKQGRRTLDTPAAREIGVEIQMLEAELASTLYTVSPLLHEAYSTRVLGEYPREYMSGFPQAAARTRSVVLTHMR
jgi:peptide/nickel transport system substrate-binding protein